MVRAGLIAALLTSPANAQRPAEQAATLRRRGCARVDDRAVAGTIGVNVLCRLF